MPCQWIKLEDGTVVHIRMSKPSRAKCEFCNKRPHTKLCDAPRGLTSTCDARICDVCAVSVGPDVDFCPNHAQRHEAMQRNLFEAS